MSNELYILHAPVCKTLALPKRIEILTTLDNKEMAVGDIFRKMSIPKATVSRHLCRISSPKVIRAYELMREVLLESHGRRDKVLRTGRE